MNAGETKGQLPFLTLWIEKHPSRSRKKGAGLYMNVDLIGTVHITLKALVQTISTPPTLLVKAMSASDVN